jgi:hypothetical protein
MFRSFMLMKSLRSAAFWQSCITQFSFENVIGPTKCVLCTGYCCAKIKHSFPLMLNNYLADVCEKSANFFTWEKYFNNCLTYDTIHIFL